MIDLAVVIPAYKAQYFEDTLSSLAAQTNKNFNVYIGDDYSPDNLRSIADKFSGRLNINYTRFPENIGPRNLVKQWKRCIDLVNNHEEWLWLFSDDDIADPDCVARFYTALGQNGDRFDIYRFNTVTIDGVGNIVQPNATGPKEESGEQMAYHLLRGERGNSMPDHIFSRAIYDYCGGFVETDFAQGADWATSVLFAQQKGICIIPQAKVYWRKSGVNISSVAAINEGAMIKGHLQFISWMLRHFGYLKNTPSGITYHMMVGAVIVNIRQVMIHHFKKLSFYNARILLNFYKSELGLSFYESIKQVYLIKEGTVPFIRKVSDLYVRFSSGLKSRIFKNSSAR
ncbi:glycosyltransferase family 2 protein [Mucilaginibacter glaciei]|uniref:Glycosyltransferase family 2 protein n=1 Tax=Mucilaginibacter glaciei TaxID=2772109 RepID=A0A926S0T2_9SPHI|nr:glycosyltransferase [Mucilaginibacter glaciei]MBD1393295.1 glycosyltransferase family 2 protein [Mucilaginibacter glaciei]